MTKYIKRLRDSRGKLRGNDVTHVNSPTGREVAAQREGVSDKPGLSYLTRQTSVKV